MNARDTERDVLMKLEKMALEVQKRNPNMSYSEAYGQALIANPALYDQYQDARDELKGRGIPPIVLPNGGRL